MAITLHAEAGMSCEDVTEVCYHNEIPAFAESELARLYGHIHSSLAFFRTSRPATQVSTYVAWQSGKPVTLLVFRREKKRIDVYNEMISITETEMSRFAGYVFRHFNDVDVISFKAVETKVRRLPYPYQRCNAKENWEIILPATPEEYTARLGKATRDNIKRYRKRLLRDHPSFEHRFHTGGEVEESQVREIIRLSQARIESKRMKFGIDEKEVGRILRLVKECGFVCIFRVGGRICAGTISYCVGTDYLAEVVAHDSRYDAYWLGTLCYYMTICESISRGAKRFHMGGGRNEYKRRLHGVRCDMDRIEIYRSYPRMILNADTVLRVAAEGCVRRIKVWLLEREKSVATRSVIRLLHAFRTLTGKAG